MLHLKQILIIVLMTMQGLAHSQTHVYDSQLSDKNWKFKGNRLECHLFHEIPNYGYIDFINRSGERLQGNLMIRFDRAKPWDTARIVFKPSEWNKIVQMSFPEWEFSTLSRNQPIKFSTIQSRRILNALNDGLVPTIMHSDATSLKENVEARLSTVHFYDAYQQYSRCQTSLVPVTFKEVRNSAVFFETASAELDVEARQWLMHVIAYIEELDVRKIDLSGFTDSIGSFRANHRLASARVRNVKNFLVENGIPNDKIIAKVFGEHRPEFDNRSKEGRSKNRRVSILIIP